MRRSTPFAVFVLGSLFAWFGGVAAVVHAQGAKTSAPIGAATKLKPGEWIWAPQASPQGPVTILVDLSKQTAIVYRNGVAIGMTTVSTGKKGHETPTGVFTILQKNAKHRSNLYNDAPMPFMQRLTWDGIALHAGYLPGSPASHGCVRMPLAFAQKLFASTAMGGTVVVTGKAGVIEQASSAGVLAPMDAKGREAVPEALPAHVTYRWTPEKSPEGPLTILVSRADSRMLVLRNGVEIGRARIELPAQDFGMHVLTYAPDSLGRERWVSVGVPGFEEKAGEELDAKVLARLRIPQDFANAVRAEIRPGTTVLVTRRPLAPETTGEQRTILDTE